MAKIYLFGDMNIIKSFINAPEGLMPRMRMRYFQDQTVRSVVDTQQIVGYVSSSTFLQNSIAVFSHGQTDIEFHFNDLLSPEQDENSTLAATAAGYVQVIQQKTANVNHSKIIVVALPPVLERDSVVGPWPTNDDKKRCAQKFNAYLQDCCQQHGLTFFNPYQAFYGEDGYLNPTMCDGSIYVGDEYVNIIFTEFQKII